MNPGGFTRSKQIALITDDFTIFQSVLEVAKSRCIDILVLSFEDPIPPNICAVITSENEYDRIDFDPERKVIFSKSPDSTINEAIKVINGNTHAGKIIIGIDPGKNPGIAVLKNDQTIAVYRVSAREVLKVIRKILAKYPSRDNIIRIGNGARLVRTRLINSLQDLGVHVEVVDETGTSPAMGRGIHGSEISDIIAAINIARLKGTSAGRQEIEPSMGEIKRIQEYSREYSRGKSTIPRDLARKVAKGELTLDEAFEIHGQPV